MKIILVVGIVMMILGLSSENKTKGDEALTIIGLIMTMIGAIGVLL